MHTCGRYADTPLSLSLSGQGSTLMSLLFLNLIETRFHYLAELA